MYDPLHSGFEDDTPPWPTTPHTPNEAVPNLRRAPSPAPSSLNSQTLDKGPTPGLYGKEPQIYGAPEPGFVSPEASIASDGTKLEKLGPYLRVRITGMDRNRRDILVRLDAQVHRGFPYLLNERALTGCVRRIYRISRGVRIGIYRGRISSFNSFMRRL